MKRLVLINIILVVLLSVIPKVERIEIVEEIIEIAETTIELRQEEISSRSLERPREEIKPQIVIATDISEQCIDLIKKYEGCRLEAYKNDEEQYYTIGYGHYGSDVKEGQVISQEEAEKLLRADIEGTKEYILKKDLGLNQNQLDALVSFSYNTGIGNFNKLIKNRNLEEIADHITAYTNKGSIYENGLTKRRTEEKELFLKEV